MKLTRQLRSTLRTMLYRSVCLLKLPLPWQAGLLPKHLFATEILTIPLNRITLYSVTDPTPPKKSYRFCFPTEEEKKMLSITSIHAVMTDDNPRSCVHNTIRDLFIEGKDFKETSQYARMLKAISDGITLYDCKTEEDVNSYFEHLDKAYQSIKSEGYKSQVDLRKSPRDETRIHISENGSLCLGSNGNHRFRIAELLDIKKIPCNIYGVNINWLVSLSEQSKLPPHLALLSWMKSQ
jgi:hypothetical protein